MSDAAPDPMDKAYAQAEAALDDDRARAARRARVLAAVASEPAAQAASPPPARRPAWAPGGWLAAACVAGVSVFLAIRVTPPAVIRDQPQPPPAALAPATPAPATNDAAAAAPAPPPVAKPAPMAREPAAPPVAGATPSLGRSPPRAAADAAPAFAPPPAELAEAPPPPAAIAQPLQRRVEGSSASRPPPAQDVQTAARRAPPPAAAPPPASSNIQELVVTGSRIESREEMRVERKARAAEDADRLRDAAGAGRIAEVKALLAKRVPVDAADEDGETALMWSIRSHEAEIAALLRRHGASLERKNRAGVSARQMAEDLNDPKLDEALGLSR